MEQLLLFKECGECSKKKHNKIIKFPHWIYWKHDECEGCNLVLSIKTLSQIHSFLRQREWDRAKLKRSPILRLKQGLRNRVRKILKTTNQPKFNISKSKLTGCTNLFLKQHLEPQFKEGMTWQNYGSGNDEWNVDHIKPMSRFDLSKLEDLKLVNHYTNLQPMWAEDNGRKGDKYE